MSAIDLLETQERVQQEKEPYRYAGILEGKVTNVDSDLGLAKVRVAGQGDDEESDWCVPCWHPAMEGTLDVGDMVFLGFRDGDVNRPVLLGWHATSNARKRPTEAVVLGTTLAGMYNDMAAKLQTAITKINQLVVDVGVINTLVNDTGLTVTGGVAKAATPIEQTSSADNDTIGKIKDADGEVVSALAGNNVALSGKAKVR